MVKKSAYYQSIHESALSSHETSYLNSTYESESQDITMKDGETVIDMQGDNMMKSVLGNMGLNACIDHVETKKKERRTLMENSISADNVTWVDSRPIKGRFYSIVCTTE